MAITIVVEDGTGLANANSYVSRAECETYHEKHLYSDDWDNASDGQKDKAIAMASMVLDRQMTWRGYQKKESQALDFPRIFIRRTDLAISETSQMWWPDDEVPQPIKDAACELARLLLGENRSEDPEGKGIKSLGLGSGALDIEFDKMDVRHTFTDDIIRLLTDFGSPKGRGGSVKLAR
jgi:hypothetical protein